MRIANAAFHSSVALCALLLSGGLLAQPSLPIDGQAIDVPLADFLKATPRAFNLRASKGNEAVLSYFYEPAGLKLEGRKVVGVGRGFFGDKGCALGIGFEKTSATEMAALVRQIGGHYAQASAPKPWGAEHMVVYLQSEQYEASLSWPVSKNNESVQLAYALTRKACGADVARVYQTRARK